MKPIKNKALKRSHTKSFFLHFKRNSVLFDEIFDPYPKYGKVKILVLQVMEISDGYFMAKVIDKSTFEKTRKHCQELYETSISQVYDFCNGLGLDYSYCEPCEAKTPTLTDGTITECAI